MSNTSHEKVTTVNVALIPVGGAASLPIHNAPTPPAGTRVVARRRSQSPLSVEIAHAFGAATELRSFADYTAQFSASAPPATQRADALEFSYAWSTAKRLAAAWLAYVNEQESLAWTFTLDKVNALRPFLRAAEQQGVSLAVAQPSLYALLDARTAAARRGRRRKAKSEPATPVATAPAAPHAAATEVHG